MANLVRREHMFDKLFDVRRNFDDIFDRFLKGSELTAESSARVIVAVPPIEAWVDNEGKKYHLSIALPGVEPEEVQLNLQGNNLTVSGEHQCGEEKKGKDYLHREFSYQRFERTVPLPEGVDTEQLTAEYNNGVLEITAPLSASALPKRIGIKSSVKTKGAAA
jgi:HSP20 family protein